MSEFFRLLTPIIYWILIILWTYIFIFYIKKFRLFKTKHLFVTLIIILLIDSFRTLFESIYFGFWYTSLAGMIPKSISTFLMKPEMVIIPKILNVVAAVFIIALMIRRWLPREEEDQIKNKYYMEKGQEIGQIGTWELDLIKNELIWTKQNYINFGVPIGTPLTYEIFLGCIHPDDRDYVNKEWMAAVEGKPYDIEHRLIVEGKVRWVREKADLEFNKDGKAVKAIGFTQNITKFKLADKELRQKEYYLEKAQEIGKVGTWELDLIKNELIWTKQTYNIFGVPYVTSLTYEIFLNCIHPDDRDFVNREWLAAVAGKPYDVDHRVIVDGEIRWVREKADIEFNKDGNAIKAIGFVQDITEQKNTENELLGITRLLEVILDNTHMLVAYMDRQFNFIKVNKIYAESDQKEQEFFPGKNHFDLFPDAENEKIFRNVVETGESFFIFSKVFEYPENPERGKTYWDWSLVPTKDSEEQVNGLVLTLVNVTNRWQAEEALRKSESNLKDAQRIAKLGSWEMDMVTKKIVWSDQLYDLLEIDQDKIPTFELYFSRVHPDDLDYVQEIGQKVLMNSEAVLAEYRMLLPSGNIKNVAVEGHQIMDDNGNVIKLTGIVLDITDRKQAEKNLQKHSFDLGERVKELNCLYELSKLVETSDISIDGILDGLINIIPPSWQYPDITCSRIILNEKEFKTANYKNTEWNQVADIMVDDKKIGKIIVSYLEEKPFMDEGPFSKEERNLINALSERLGRILERLTAENALLKSEERLKKFMESATEGFVLYDSKLNLEMMNKTSLEIMKCKIKDIIGKNIIELSPGLKNSPRYDIYKRVLETGKPVTLEDTISLNGQQDMNLSIKAFKVGSGLGFTYSDITANRKAEEEKVKLEEQIQQVQKMDAIGTLAGGIAHQFNNALSGIVGNIDLLEIDFPGDKNIDKYAKRMKISSNRMTKLTKQLLAYARGGKYQEKVISGNDLIRDAVNLTKYTVGQEINIDTDIPSNIFSVRADITQIQMVISTILSNASEAIEGKGLIRITCKNKVISDKKGEDSANLKAGKYVFIKIEDDGPGMDEETLSRVFEPFFTTKFTGRGLGMAAAYGIINNHNGSIIVNSKIGRGTTVSIYLPAVKAPEKVPEVQKPGIITAKSTGTILVIEDEVMVKEVISAQLEQLGYRIITAETGKEAINIVRTFDGDIDLILLDMILPDKVGIEIYKQIIKARPDMKVIVFSGYSIDGPAKEVLDEGAEDFIQKPFRMVELSEKLRKVLGSK